MGMEFCPGVYFVTGGVLAVLGSSVLRILYHLYPFGLELWLSSVVPLTGNSYHKHKGAQPEIPKGLSLAGWWRRKSSYPQGSLRVRLCCVTTMLYVSYLAHLNSQ